MTSTEQTDAGTGESRYYPLFLRLAGRRCLVVGGGAVAARKTASLCAAGGVVTVVAPELGLASRTELSVAMGWHWEEREFVPEDARGCALVIAATDDGAVNRAVLEAARAAGAWASSVDDPDEGDFIVPAVVSRGALQLAVGTSGRAPAVAAAVRRRLEAIFSPQWGGAVDVLARARALVGDLGLDEQKRGALNRELAQLDIAALLDEGGLPSVEQAVASCISRFSE